MNKCVKGDMDMFCCSVRYALFTFFFTAAVFLSGCGSFTGSSVQVEEHGPSGSARISITASSSSPFSRLAESATATVSADDMTTRVFDLTVTDTSVAGTLEKIPAGDGRHIVIEVYDTDAVVQYRGSAIATVNPDSITLVAIDIVRVKGALEVNGTVIDDEGSVNRDLVAYYPFNGTARDASGYVNDGHVYGATLSTGHDGAEQSAYMFNGKDEYIEVPYAESLDCEEKITLMLWAKSSVMGSEYSETATLIQMGEGSESSYDVLVNHNIDKISIQYRCHWTDEEIIDGGIYAENVLDTSWHFYAMTFDGETLKAYIDNEYIGGIEAKAGTIKDLPLRIGAQSKSLDRYWNGSIDEVRIFRRALTEEEVAAFYSSEG